MHRHGLRDAEERRVERGEHQEPIHRDVEKRRDHLRSARDQEVDAFVDLGLEERESRAHPFAAIA